MEDLQVLNLAAVLNSDSATLPVSHHSDARHLAGLLVAPFAETSAAGTLACEGFATRVTGHANQYSYLYVSSKISKTYLRTSGGERLPK